MDVRTCRNCGKLYNYLGKITPFCPQCMKELEEKFNQCKTYIKENPGANISKVSEDTGVSIKMLKQWVREERLSFAEGTAVGIECEICGANILTGRFCAKCKQNTASQLNNLLQSGKKEPPKPAKKEGGKMRFLDE